MKAGIVLAAFIVSVGAGSVAARAESLTTTKRVCKSLFDQPAPVQPPATPEPQWKLHAAEECVVDLFTLDPVGPAAGNIGPGSGFGGGLHVVHSPTAYQKITLKGLYSVKSSYIASGQYHTVFRTPWKIMIPGAHGTPGTIDDTRGTLDFTLERYDLRTQDFYGEGPNSTLAGHSVYRRQQTWFGVSNATPLPGISGRAGIVKALLEVRYMVPKTKGVSHDSLPSVNRFYGEAGAPGSTTQQNFLVLRAGLGLATPTVKTSLHEAHWAQLMYSHYLDTDSKAHSFDRLDGSGAVLLDVTGKATGNGRWKKVDLDRSKWKDMLCMQQAVGGCKVGTVKLGGLFSTSYTGTGSSVPFFLQPTLGGSDYEGVDTLRGLVDFRLRAPNRVLFQADFDKPIANLGLKKKVNGEMRSSALGQYGLYAFVDGGNVSMMPGDLFGSGWRKDVGVGASIAVQNKVVIRVYVAFGAGEGSHPNAKMANAF